MPYLVKIHMRYGLQVETACPDQAQVDAFLSAARQAWEQPPDKRCGHFTVEGADDSSKVCLSATAIEAIVITEESA